MTRDAFIIFTHFLNDRVMALVDRAQRELADTHDVHVIGYFPDEASIPRDFLRLRVSVPCTAEDLKDLRFPGVAEAAGYRIIPGDADMPLLWFARNNPQYSTFWSFEGDVEFTGSLRMLIEHLEQSDADLLLTRLQPAVPGWPNFRNRSLPEGWPDPEVSRLCGFLPVYRVSRRFLDALGDFYSAGGRGHFEWVWPQVAVRRGFECRDLADFPLHGRPLYTRWPELRGRSLGTFRYGPAMHRPGRRRNTLWHPVKDRPVSLLRERVLPSLRLLAKVLEDRNPLASARRIPAPRQQEDDGRSSSPSG